MNIALIEKSWGRLNRWTQPIRQLRWGLVLLLVLGLCSGNSQSANAHSLFSQFNPISASQPIFISQSSLPASVETAIRQDLSSRTRMGENKFIVKQASRQTWPDGCLGLGTENELCTQALVEGWRVVMQYQDKTWVYRTDDNGMTIRLERGTQKRNYDDLK